jgi:DNA adenine methylase
MLVRDERYLSPLRYPGGKAKFAALLRSILQRNELVGCEYYEPFAGGAGAALRLLKDGTVSHLHLNDADYRIYALWRAVFYHNDALVDALLKADVTINDWHKQFAICKAPERHRAFSVAFATLFLNRCNRSGVILGSRPIGGLKQDGAFKIDARFNRTALAERVKALAPFKASVTLYNEDALTFLQSRLPKGARRRKVFAYLDPPYYSEGRRLYLSYYSDADHRDLSRYIRRQTALRWVMSYDDNTAIRKLYGRLVRRSVRVDYSLYSRRAGEELLIAPDGLRLPRFALPWSE